MKLKRTLPSVTKTLVKKQNAQFNSESSDEEQGKAGLASHVWKKNKIEKREEELITSKMMKNNLRIFKQKNNENEKEEKEKPSQIKFKITASNQISSNVQDQQYQRDTFRKKYQPNSSGYEDNGLTKVVVESGSDSQRIQRIQKDEQLMIRLQKSASQKAPTRRTNIFNKKKGYLSHNKFQQDQKQNETQINVHHVLIQNKNQGPFQPESSRLVLQKITSLQSTIKDLQEQIITNKSKQKPQGYEKNESLKEKQKFFNKDYSNFVEQFGMRNSESRNWTNQSQLLKKESKNKLENLRSYRNSKILALQIEQMKRCERIANQNQMLYSKLCDSLNSSSITRSFPRSSVIKFQDFNAQEDARNSILYSNSEYFNAYNKSDEDEEYHKIESPFALEENNISQSFNKAHTIRNSHKQHLDSHFASRQKQNKSRSQYSGFIRNKSVAMGRRR